MEKEKRKWSERRIFFQFFLTLFLVLSGMHMAQEEVNAAGCESNVSTSSCFMADKQYVDVGVKTRLSWNIKGDYSGCYSWSNPNNIDFPADREHQLYFGSFPDNKMLISGEKNVTIRSVEKNIFSLICSKRSGGGTKWFNTEVIGMSSGGGTTPPSSAPSYNLTLNFNPQFGGRVQGNNINCDSNCTQTSYASGSTVNLAVTQQYNGYTFSGWSGEGCSGIGTCAVTMNSNKIVVANFTSVSSDGGACFGPGPCGNPRNVINIDEVKVTVTGPGRVKDGMGGELGLDCGPNDGVSTVTCSKTDFKSIAVVAWPSSGSTVAWTGCPYSEGNKCYLTENAAVASVAGTVNVTAIFSDGGRSGGSTEKPLVPPVLSATCSNSTGTEAVLNWTSAGDGAISYTFHPVTFGINVTSPHKVSVDPGVENKAYVVAFRNSESIWSNEVSFKCEQRSAENSLIKIDGTCGSAARNYTETETALSGSLCYTGIPDPINVGFPQNDTPAVWTCKGLTGGVDSALCRATRGNSTPPGACSLYTATGALPEGYGSPFNQLSTAKEPTLTVSCGTNGSVATSESATVATAGSQATYTYKTGFASENGQWKKIDFSGMPMSNNAGWFQGSALSNIPSPSAGNVNFVIAFVCQYQNNAWKCGCRDSACTQNYWTIQAYGTSFRL